MIIILPGVISCFILKGCVVPWFQTFPVAFRLDDRGSGWDFSRISDRSSCLPVMKVLTESCGNEAFLFFLPLQKSFDVRGGFGVAAPSSASPFCRSLIKQKPIKIDL